MESKKSGNVVYNFGNYAAAATIADKQAFKGIKFEVEDNNFNDMKYLNSSIFETKILEFNRVFELGKEIINKMMEVIIAYLINLITIILEQSFLIKL